MTYTEEGKYPKHCSFSEDPSATSLLLDVKAPHEHLSTFTNFHMILNKSMTQNAERGPVRGLGGSRAPAARPENPGSVSGTHMVKERINSLTSTLHGMHR